MNSSQHPRFRLFGLLLCLTLTLWSGITLGQSVPSYVPSSGLVGWWGFNGNAQDESGNGNHGTVNGANSYITNRNNNSNSAISLVGNNSVLSSQGGHFIFPQNALIDTISFTISIWVKPIAIYSDGESYIQFGLMQDVTRDVMIHYSFNELAFRVGNAVLSLYNADTLYNNWHHFVISYSGNLMNVYKNGILFGSAYNSNQLEINVAMMGVGRHWWGTPTNYNTSTRFNGNIDDIGIWNRALTQQEITNLYNAQVCQVSVTTQPSNQTSTSGQNIQITVGSSEPNSTFQWQSNSGSGFQDVVDGGQYSGSSTSILSITGLTLQNNNQEFRCIVSAQNCGSDTSDVATLNVTNPNGVTGTLMYAHSPASPLVGVPVHLKSYLGYTAASDTTDSTGTYHLSGFPNGNYYLDADINYEVNGINSSDALLAQRFVIMLEVLSNLQQKSADVSGDQRIRTSDALMITMYTASLINQFPVGRFVNTRPDVTASGSVQSVNMLALASGDVNGNLLVQSSPPTLVLDTVYSSGTQGTATVRFTASGSGIYERGVCWGTSPNPTTDSSKSVAGTGGFGFTHSFGGLTTGIQYHVRAYAMNSVGTYYSNERSFTLLTIGSNYAGGIIFYLDSTGQHGLVCAPNDQGVFEWGCIDSSITGTSTEFGTGNSNTIAILNGCVQRPIAASICYDLVLNGFDDWYLPSRDELYILYQSLATQGVGSFGLHYFWSSSQYIWPTPMDHAWNLGFFMFGPQQPHQNASPKSSLFHVRAIRSF